MRNRSSLKYNRYCSMKCIDSASKNNLPLKCHCGESFPIMDWTWSNVHSSSSTRFSNDNREILFHPIYSSGTAAVVGTKAFEKNLHHYWEIKVITNLYGTDVMVGVGTSQVNMSQWNLKFCSMLGKDFQSWGYSYTGQIQEKGIKRPYGPAFGVCSIIGIHLDMCNGTLEYYFNRNPLGIAFRGLKAKQLYAMVSSTAARSSVRLICAVSEKPTLQLLCLREIVKNPVLYKEYSEIPGLKKICNGKYFWVVPPKGLEQTEVKTNEKLMDLST